MISDTPPGPNGHLPVVLTELEGSPVVQTVMTSVRKVLKGTFIKDIFVVSFGNGLARSFAFFSAVFLARLLGPSGFADFSIFFTLAVLSSLVFGGFDSAFVRFYALDRSPSALRASMLIKAVSSVLILLAGWVFLGPIAGYLRFGGDRDYIFLALLAGVAVHFMSLPLSYLQAQERFVLYSVFLAAPQVLFLALALVFGLGAGSADYRTYALLYLASFSASSLLSLALLFRRGDLSGGGSVGKDAARIFGFGKWLVLSTLLYSFYQRVDLLILSHFADKATVGAYGAAIRISGLVQIVTGAVLIIGNPKASRLSSYPEIRTYLLKCYRTAALVTVPLLGLIALRVPIVRLMLGRAYLPAASPFALLSLGCIVVMFTTPLLLLFYTIDRPQFVFAKAVAMSLALPGLSYLLIPSMSATGAALSVLLTQVLGALLAAGMIATQWKGRVLTMGESGAREAGW